MVLFDRISYVPLKHVYLNLEGGNSTTNQPAQNVILVGLLCHDSEEWHTMFILSVYWDMTLRHGIVESRRFE